jgi:hypothetical protein
MKTKMKEKAMTIKTWWQESTTKQKIIIGIGLLLMIFLLVMGTLMLIPDQTVNPSVVKGSNTVTVKDIKKADENKKTPVPAETKVVEEAAQIKMTETTETNATTVDTPQVETEEYYTSEDTGGRYEAPQEPVYEEPVYEEPVYEEPVYEEPVYQEPVYEEPAPSDNDWFVGGEVADDTGNDWGDGSGSGVSN